ncbi:MAG: sulfurtransferase TusA family protein [Pirellulaceae bacterium]|nr:sulfurtransferase TusA family protein [Pirellulaceae bacterium]
MHEPDQLPNTDDQWDAGEMGCGELILKLNVRLRKMQPTQVLLLIALDTGAIADIPAWCEMTRHTLVCAQHPNYWIRRRTDP